MLAGRRPSSISGLQPRDDGENQRGQDRRQTDAPTALNDGEDEGRVKVELSMFKPIVEVLVWTSALLHEQLFPFQTELLTLQAKHANICKSNKSVSKNMSEPFLHIPLHCRNVTLSLAPAKITYFICAAEAATKEKYSTCTSAGAVLWLY